jgi:glutamine cyclotransferase
MNDGITPARYLFLAAAALLLSCPTTAARAQESLTLLKKYDLGADRYSEGLDFYNDFLWHTTRGNLFQLDPAGATDTDGDGDYDLQAEKTWTFTHSHHSESSVWCEDQLFNFTYLDTTVNFSDDIFRLDLNADETYQYAHAGDGLGTTNWGSCRDKRHPGTAIIYTGHYDNLLMWYDPASGVTAQVVEVTDLDEIEDLGMDQYGTVWASSFDRDSYPYLYRINPASGKIVEAYVAPEELAIIDGIAIRSAGDHEVMYVTGKNSQFIWEYLVPPWATSESPDVPAATALQLHPNYPNPFNPTTTLAFTLPTAQRVRLCVYGLNGIRIKTLVAGTRPAGTYSVTWHGTDDHGRAVASGTYIYRLEAGGSAVSRRMMLVR